MSFSKCTCLGFFFLCCTKLWGLNANSDVSLSPKPNSRLVWKDQYRQLYVKNNFGLQESARISVIKIPRDFPLEQYITKDKILLRDEYDFYFHIAVIKIDDLKELNNLSQHAHLAGGQCGLIETFKLNNQLLDLDDLIAPVFSSMVTLPAVADLLPLVTQSNVLVDIDRLVALGSRFHSTGATAPDEVAAIFTERANSSANITISQYEHSGTEQNSVIATITGTEFPDEKVIIGSHLDSINPSDNSDAPGADDNASGVAIQAELIRIIAAENLSFKRTVEIQAYGAEEIGLVGSGDIAGNYLSEQQNVVAAMQIDMTMYGSGGEDPTIWLVKTDSSVDTTRSAANLIANYLDNGFSFGTLSGGTSDHKSWFDRGVPTLFAFESVTNYNPYIHTSSDTTDKFNNLALNLGINKLALLYLAHYAGLEGVDDSYASLKGDAFSDSGSDLALAITSNDHLAAGTTQDIEHLEFCQISDASDLDCSYERQVLDAYEDRGSRRIFYSETSFTLAASQKWRVWAYNSDHQLTFKRDVQLTE